MSDSPETDPKAPLPEGERPELESARDMLLIAAEVFSRWERRLQDVVERLPNPRFASGSDDPLNLPAAVQGLLEGVLSDEIGQTVDTLRRAASWLDEPTAWQQDSHPKSDPS